MRSGFTNFNANNSLNLDRLPKSILTCDADMNCKLNDNVSRFAENAKNLAKKGANMVGTSDKVANAVQSFKTGAVAGAINARKAISNKNSL